QGYGVFVEVGPNAALVGMGKRCVPEAGLTWLASLKRGQGEWETLLGSVGALYVQGVPLDWVGFDRDYGRRRVVLPNYPFERQRCWLETASPVVGKEEEPSRAQVIQTTSHTGAREIGREEEEIDRLKEEARMLESPMVTARESTRLQALLSKLQEMTGPLLHIEPAKVDVDARFLEMGADSLVLIEAVRTIEETFGITLTIQQLFEDVTNLADLAAYLDRMLPPDVIVTGPAERKVEPAAPIPLAAPVPVVSPLPNGQEQVQAAISASALEQLFAQQLQIMSQQLELLRTGNGSWQSGSSGDGNSHRSSDHHPIAADGSELVEIEL
ncbi:MAG TPA: phosphopantetheine-binding protein, partial [Anaerolineae bacterium]|nr:phosphopantetheine-binding protein [Anaerolineae bacterium]